MANRRELLGRVKSPAEIAYDENGKPYNPKWKLGERQGFDPKATRLFYPTMRPPKVWTLPRRVRQNGGKCVGFSGTHWVNGTPIPHSYDEKYGDSLYADCKKVDGFPNEEGSTIHALAKVLKDRNIIKGYAWAQRLGEVREQILTVGPSELGTDWTSCMFEPDDNGYVKPCGSVEGGHAYAGFGWIPRYRFTILWDDVLCPNSWEDDWGGFEYGGRFYRGWFRMKAIYLAYLMKREGEVMAAVEGK